MFVLFYKAKRSQVPEHYKVYGLRHENFKCHKLNESDHLKVLNIQGDSRAKVNIIAGDSIGHCEKKKGHVNMCQYVSYC
jgi:hypothetical protein